MLRPFSQPLFRSPVADCSTAAAAVATAACVFSSFAPSSPSTPAAAPGAGGGANAPAGAAGAANPWANLRSGAGMPGMGGMPGMPGGGQMDPAMMSQMMNNPMVQQVHNLFGDRPGMLVSCREGGGRSRAVLWGGRGGACPD